jgi:transcriptional regulator with XRE-family HTH domain
LISSGAVEYKLGPMTPRQCRAARALLGWTQADLAELAGLGLSTIEDFEVSRRVLPKDTVAAIQETLEINGIELINESGVRLRDRA